MSSGNSRDRLLRELDELRTRVATFESREAEWSLTDRVQRQSLEQLQAIYDGTPDALAIVDAETFRCVRCNARLCQMLGYGEGELPTDLSKLHPPEDLPWIRERFLAQAAGNLPLAENIPFRRKDGTVFFADITGNRITCDGRPCLLVFGRDVTARKQAQDALQESLAQLETIYNGMIEGLLITDIATKQFVRANASLCRMLGYTEEELLKASIKDIHPPEEVPNDLQRFQAAADGRVWINEDRPVLRKDGSIFYADITGHPIMYAGRRCLLALFRDVTERRQAHEALMRERKTLQHMLRASDHERQVIAYEIHDGLAQQLAAAIMQLQSYEALKHHQPAQAETAYSAGVQMLRGAHVEARRLISGVRPPILDESGVAAAIAHLVHDHRTPSGPEIEFHGLARFDRLASVLENAIYRIAQEALSNACRHSRSDRVRVSLLQEDAHIRLEVQDWGIGFEPDGIAGEHFGLEGIRERARLLGGTASIESDPGQGTLVAVLLPLIGRDGEETSGFAAIESSVGSKYFR